MVWGKNFDPNKGGASIISEIKKNYPNKIAIAYTGTRTNANLAIEAKKHADAFIRKDADMQEWQKVLDQYIDTMIDPYKVWIRTRTTLLSHSIDLREIVRIEDAYVRDIRSKNSNFDKTNSIIGRIDLNENVKPILQSVIGSAIFAIIFA